ncbi:OpgC domain-containing protein [Bradyrhizobium sp. 182]|uniref:OpgC family protein n=1 Tax=Bradyrhizobium sp. 182 TaxID=2782651 RepID=UPI001FF7FB83|nr:OpgC domain-containing protein [Bradyrhizobium sp. 182]MCK1526471.1 OpgC domain-containing protein [Bradyrhizobium sp. 182]
MTEKAANPARRDIRLDLFRGLANWAIFLDHIPNNVVAWVTMKNYGFSDAADLFVFVSGYTVAYVYSRTMATKGFLVAAVGIMARAWQIYVAHILLFVFYVASIGYVAQRYGHAHLLDEFNIRRLIADPIEFLKHALLLEFKPLNIDVLPLYIALMATFPPVLWLLVRSRNLALATSFAIYAAARAFGWNLPSYPEGFWYFNPFAWQFLFVIGAWVALDRTETIGRLIGSRAAALSAALFLLLGLVVRLAARLGFADAMSEALVDVFVPNDKTNLAPYRILHFLALALIVARFVPRHASWLTSPLLRPSSICGERSLEVFCVGIFLSFIGHFLIELVSGSIAFQMLVALGGICAMTAVASYRPGSRTSDRPLALDP